MAVKSADQITIVDLTDAYSLTLTNESYVFPGDVSNALAGSTTTQLIGYCGSEQATVAVDTSSLTLPTGVTVTSDGKSPWPTLTFTVTTACKAAGTVSVPATLNGDVTITKTFAYSIAFKGATGQTGATGKGVKSSEVTYQKSTSGTTTPTGSWGTSIPSLSAGEYLWTKTVITYTDSTTSTSYSVGMKGETGAAGADAVTVSITSSAGLIFKNSGVSTTLTAHVYQGGKELDATAVAKLGTIKWYKDGSTTALSTTGATLSVAASDVTNKASYVAQLEG